jgi:hypothetical protein
MPEMRSNKTGAGSYVKFGWARDGDRLAGCLSLASGIGAES